MIKRNSFLILILLLALSIRVYKLGEIPVSLFMDEASVGYDAISLWGSGMDQWGKSWPIIFKSFGEYKYPWHIYGALISGSLIGWSEFSIRLPSAFVGVINVYVLYLLAKLITGKKSIGLYAALFLAVSPWHVQFTRMAWESGYVLFFLYMGFWLFQKGFTGNGWWLILGSLFLGLSLFAYNSAKIVVPILFGWTLFLNWNYFKNKLVWFFGASLILLIFVGLSFSNHDLSGLERYKQVGVKEETVRQTNLFKATNNYRAGLIEVWSMQYLEHFSPQFLFISGDLNPRHSTQAVGELLLVEFILVLCGLVRLIVKREKWLFWILGWVLISPIPAAMTVGVPHALRAILSLGGWQILAAAGLEIVISTLSKSRNRNIYTVILVSIITLNIGYYLYQYFEIYPRKYSTDWQYGYSKIFQNEGEYDRYDAVVVSDRYGHPYIFMAWKYRMNYEDFHKNLVYNNEPRNVTSLVKRMGNVYFEEIDVSNLPKGNLLIYATPNDKLSQITEKDVIKNPDGTIAFYVYEYKNK